MKKITLLLLFIMGLGSLVSCDNQNVTIRDGFVYTFSKFDSQNQRDVETVESYLRTIDIIIDEEFYLDGNSSMANDRDAIADFNKAVERIEADDIIALGISNTATFTLILKGKSTDPTLDQPLAAYQYPQ